MMVTGPSGSGKTEWTRKLLLSSLVQPPPERILRCFGQWQPLYEDLQKRIPCIEFIRGIPDYLDNASTSTSVTFMRKFEDATARPYGYLILDLKSSTSEQDRLQTDIFVDQQSPDDGDISDDEDADSVESLDYIRTIRPQDKERDESYKPDIWNRRVSDLSPPGKRRKLRDERSKPDIWNRRFQNPIRQENVEQFKAKVNAYEERGFSSDKAIHLAANDDLPSLRKRLRLDYAQFLIDYYELQEDPVQQLILESA